MTQVVTTVKDARFMSVHDKRLVLQQWMRFLDSGFDRTKFTKRFYEHLSLHCAFIAHYDINGFWQHYFARGSEARRLAFILQFDRANNPVNVGAEIGMSYWAGGNEYGDINQAMIDVMTERAPILVHVAEDEKRATIRAEIARLEAQL